jgi:hypothetical protein
MPRHRNSLTITRRDRPSISCAGLLGIMVMLALQGRAVQAAQASPDAAAEVGVYKLYCPGNFLWRGDLPNTEGWWNCETTQICGQHYGECISPGANK